MTSARRFYRISLGLSLAGTGAVLAGLAVSLSTVSLAPPPVGALASACGRLLPAMSLGTVLALVLAGLGFSVLARAWRSLFRQLRAQRAFLREIGRAWPAEVDGVPVNLVECERPLAFCAGHVRPRIYVTRGAAERLSTPQLRAVLAHERQHQLRRDPLRILLAGVFAESLFFLPALGRLADRYAALAEVAADEAALRQSTDRRALASALLALGESGAAGAVVGIAPERVDHLLGSRPRWQLPQAPLVGSIAALAGLAALVLVLPAAMGSAAVDLPLLLAQSCMLLMVAAPLAVAVAAFRYGVPLARGRR